MAFSGPIDEYRLRRALVRGEYPVPGRAAQQVLSGRSLPTRRQTAPPEVFGHSPHPSMRSNTETPVPPT
jgi:hypothetical protein